MDKYKVLEQIGSGSYSTVYRALSLQKGNEVVALKRMKGAFKTWEECLRLREIQSLKGMQCANVVRLLEAVRENEELVLVFEYCEGSLHQAILAQKSRGKDFAEGQIRGAIQQLLTALDYIHRKGYFHRDIKPENILLNTDGMLKLSDFGLAREIRSRPPFSDYVATRWYRAPENLLRSVNYNSPSDLWGVGCITAEMFTRQPLFPGRSEADQLFKLCAVCGTPDESNWPSGMQLAQQRGIRFPQVARTELSKLIPNASTLAIQFMETVIQFDPANRPSAAHALSHEFFKGPCEKILLQLSRPSVPQQQQPPPPLYSDVARGGMNGIGNGPYQPQQQSKYQQGILSGMYQNTGMYPDQISSPGRQARHSRLGILDQQGPSQTKYDGPKYDVKHHEPKSCLSENTVNSRGAQPYGQQSTPLQPARALNDRTNINRLKQQHRSRMADIPGIDGCHDDATEGRMGLKSTLGGTMADDDLADLFWRKTASNMGVSADSHAENHGMSHFNSSQNYGTSPPAARGSPPAPHQRGLNGKGNDLKGGRDDSSSDVKIDRMDDEAIAELLSGGFASGGVPRPRPPVRQASDIASRGTLPRQTMDPPTTREESLGSALDELDRFMCGLTT